MWDLIVPVPDHCLSFYFLQWKALNLMKMPNKNVKCG